MRLHHPLADLGRGVEIREFFVHGRRNEYAPVQLRKNFDRFNQDKIIEWRRVSDNQRHLEAELAMSLAVAIEVFQGIFQLDAVVFQESVDLHARLEAEELAQEGCGDFAGAVGFQGESFQGRTGEILALGGESREELVWKRDGDVLHGFRILEEPVKSTAGELKVQS